jgi:hypothetical protein
MKTEECEEKASIWLSHGVLKVIEALGCCCGERRKKNEKLSLLMFVH